MGNRHPRISWCLHSVVLGFTVVLIVIHVKPGCAEQGMYKLLVNINKDIPQINVKLENNIK